MDMPRERNGSMPENQMTVIGPDARFKGELHFEGSARILGEYEGSIVTPGRVEIASGGRCNAKVDAQRIVVDGRAEGELIGRDRIEMNPTAHVRADISAGNLIVQDGASFVGHCSVGPDAVARASGEGRMPSQEREPKGTARPTEPAEIVVPRSVRPASAPAKVEADVPGGVRTDLQSDWMRLAQGAGDGQKRIG